MRVVILKSMVLSTALNSHASQHYRAMTPPPPPNKVPYCKLQFKTHWLPYMFWMRNRNTHIGSHEKHKVNTKAM